MDKYKIKAFIDTGTNSTRLFIAKVLYRKKQIEPLYKEVIITRTGEGIIKTGEISNSAIKRAIKVYKKYIKICERYNADYIKIIGTSSFREAKNKKEVLDKIYRETNIKVDILDEEEEAYLTALGAISSIKQKINSAVILDIGGGSTEIIQILKGKIKKIDSIKIGVVKLLDTFKKKGKLTEKEIYSIREYINKEIRKINRKKYKYIIGVGGTPTSLSAILLCLKKYNGDIVHSSEFDFKIVEELTKLICSLSLKEKLRIPFIDKGRADLLSYGLIFLVEVMKYFKVKKLIVSDKSILYGLALKNIIR